MNVATEAQLQAAMGSLQSGDTLLLSNGTYNLVVTNISGTGGVLEITDTNAAGQARQFYRVHLSP